MPFRGVEQEGINNHWVGRRSKELENFTGIRVRDLDNPLQKRSWMEDTSKFESSSLTLWEDLIVAFQ